MALNFTKRPGLVVYVTCGDPDTCPFKYEFGEFNQLGINVTFQAKF